MSYVKLTAVHRSNLSEDVVESIRAEIVSGRWPVGERIPAEPALVNDLGVSRGTLREALRSLQYSGLLEIRRGDGTYVRSRSEIGQALAHSRPALAEVLEARGALEPQLARLAAMRASEEDIARIRSALEEKASAGDDEWVAADLNVHLSIAEAAHSPVLYDIYQALLPHAEGSMAEQIDKPGFQRDEPRGHEEVLMAIEKRDPEAARLSAESNLSATLNWDQS